jgi:hypothetical protein
MRDFCHETAGGSSAKLDHGKVWATGEMTSWGERSPIPVVVLPLGLTEPLGLLKHQAR